ncbi:MAG TPA: hypothetical protein VF892_10570 [Pseudonocardiaceae bacterium]
MEQAEIDRVEQDVKARFPEGAVRQVVVLQYGDDPVIEPGRLGLRVVVSLADHGSLHEFHLAHDEVMKQLKLDAERKVPELTRIEFVPDDTTPAEKGDNSRLVMGLGRSDGRAGGLTPVMARLEPVDLETLDTLITAGIATNRAEAVRWALARIRERPAYGQLRERAREIEELKAQF